MIDRAWETWAANEAALMPMRAAGFDPACTGCRIEHRTGGKYVGAHACEGSRGMFRRPPPPAVPPVLTEPQWKLLGGMLGPPVRGAECRFVVWRRLVTLGLVMFVGDGKYEITPAGRAAHAAQTSEGGGFFVKPRSIAIPASEASR